MVQAGRVPPHDRAMRHTASGDGVPMTCRATIVEAGVIVIAGALKANDSLGTALSSTVITSSAL